MNTTSKNLGCRLHVSSETNDERWPCSLDDLELENANLSLWTDEQTTDHPTYVFLSIRVHCVFASIPLELHTLKESKRSLERTDQQR